MSQENDYAGWNHTILSGWGKVEQNENVTSDIRTLQKVTLPIVSDAKCTENIIVRTPEIADSIINIKYA